MFKSQKLSNYGTSTPAVARIVLQAKPIADVFNCMDEQRTALLEKLFDIQRHLLKCVECRDSLAAEIEEERTSYVTPQAGDPRVLRLIGESIGVWMGTDISSWDAEPLDAFERFLRSEAFVAIGRERESGFERRFVQEDTAKVYLLMFRQFGKWLKARGQPFTLLGAGGILDFYLVVRQSASSSLSMHYIRMLKRCYIHVKINNPDRAAAALGQARKAAEKPKDKDYIVMALPDCPRVG